MIARGLDAILRDLVYAVRGLRRAPGFAVAAALTLALGVGMSTAMVSVFRSTILQKLPVRDQDRLVILWPIAQGGTEVPLEYQEFERLRDQSQSLESTAGFAHWGAAETAVTNGDVPVHIRQALVTGNFFKVLGASPVLGRLLQPADKEESADHPIVISYSTWQRQFTGDRAVLGKRLRMRYTDWSYTIVGVAPPGLDYPVGTDYWAPIWTGAPVDLIGRLKVGISARAAEAELAENVRQYQKRTGDGRAVGASAKSLAESISGDVKPAVIVMLAAAGMLLLIACINVGNLLLLRGAARGRELAVRQALGAAQSDLVRQALIESTVLGVTGGLLGLGVASALLDLLVFAAPQELPRMDLLRFGGAPFLTGLVVTFATVVLTGLAPALARQRHADAQILRADRRAGTETRSRRGLRQVLVAGQVALALVVLAGASLVAKSLLRLERLPLGLTPDRLLMVRVIPPVTKDTTYRDYLSRLNRILPAIEAVPGVTAATPILAEPFTGANTFAGALEAEGRTLPPGQAHPLASFDAVGPDFFKTFELSLVRGRTFSAEDRPDAPPVTIVSKTVAGWFWPGDNPIGKRIRFFGDTGQKGWRTVIGISEDIHFREFRTATPMMFVQYEQMAFWQGLVAVRTKGDPALAVRAIREAIHQTDPELVFWQADEMRHLIAGPLARPRLEATLLLGFAAAALILAILGLYTVIAETVKQRTREFGIRIALGAAPGRVERHVMGEAFVLIGIGAAVGMTVALAGSRLLTAILFQVSPADPFALLAAMTVLGIAGALAGYLPARRATQINPVESLRSD